MKLSARLLLVLAILCASSRLALAVDPPRPIDDGGVTGIDLKTQLEKGLKARRPVEFQYIAQIIDLVESGALPRSLVTTTFGWARKKQNRQLQYFQFALEARTRGMGIAMPDLSKQAVGIGSNGGRHGFGN